MPTTLGLAIAGLDVVSFGCSSLSTSVPAGRFSIWLLVFIFNIGFSIGFGYRLDLIKFPAIAKPCPLQASQNDKHYLLNPKHGIIKLTYFKMKSKGLEDLKYLFKRLYYIL